LIRPPELDADGKRLDTQVFCPHLGILVLTTLLKEKGYDVDFLDAQSFAEVERMAGKDQYDLIGITCFTASRESVFECSRRIKKHAPESLIVLGGPHASALDREILERVPEVDCIIRGEGEIPLLSLVENMIDLKSVPSLTWRDRSQIRQNPMCAPVDITKVPFPDLSLIDLEHYLPTMNMLGHRNKRWIHFITSRGCPGKCIFCSTPQNWGQNLRRYSPKTVVERLKFLVETYHTNGIFFYDDTFNTDTEWVIEFCNRFEAEQFDIPWWCIGRVDKVDPKALRHMKKAGCFAMKFGVESGSERMLRRIGKKITLDQVRYAVDQTQAAGMFVGTGFILGLPGETREEMHESKAFIKSLNVDFFHYNVPMVFPGTTLFEIAKKENKLDIDYFFTPQQTTENFDAREASPQTRSPFPTYVPNGFTEREFLDFAGEFLKELQTYYAERLRAMRSWIGGTPI
jgi:radical SAM superfamily enzyme YgiQ (UPF0313 family)